jgi:WhiB family redox-sensing transcriptional regulator
MQHPFNFDEPACSEVGGDFWFPERVEGGGNSTELRMAKAICSRCPHLNECLEWGLKRERYGIWGGLSESEREAVRKERKILLKEEGVA